jgi:hypothetical protein
MKTFTTVLFVAVCLVAFATFASCQDDSTPEPPQTQPPIPTLPPFGRKKRQIGVPAAPTTESSSSEAPASDSGSGEARKKRMVVYTVRDLIETKYTRI